MGKFSAAKIFDALDQKLQKAMNYLIDLLETGYVTEAYVNGHKIQVRITPQNAFEIYIDNVKTMGISSDGKAFIQSISNLTNGSYYMTYGYNGSPGIECFMPTIGKWLGISPDVNGGIQIYDKNSVARLALSVNGDFRIFDDNAQARHSIWGDGTGSMKDGSDNFILTYNPTDTQIRFGGATPDNRLGVDATGAYKITAGVKAYL